MNKSVTTVIALVACATSILALSAWTRAPESPDRVTRTGTISGWSIAADGTVALKLDGEHRGRSFSLWFATPANRTAATRYEQLVLEAVMAVVHSGKPARVTITSESSNDDSGETVAEALPLTRLSQP